MNKERTMHLAAKDVGKNSWNNRQAVVRSVVVSCLVLALASLASAKDGRDFAGFYALSNVQDLNGGQAVSAESGTSDDPKADRMAKVSLTLSVDVFNNGEMGDIHKPVILLLASGPSHTKLGKFGAIKVLPSKRDAIVSGQFTVSREEWKRGATVAGGRRWWWFTRTKLGWPSSKPSNCRGGQCCRLRRRNNGEPSRFLAKTGTWQPGGLDPIRKTKEFEDHQHLGEKNMRNFA